MKDMTKGHGLSQVLGFAVVLFAGSLLNQVHVLVDSIIVGRFLGVNALAAIGVAGPLIYFIVAVFLGINIGFSILVSQYKGANDDDSIQRCVSTLLTALALCGLVLSCVAFQFSGPLLALFDVDEAVLNLAKTYFNITSMSLIFGFISMGLGAILRALGDGVTPLYALAIASLLNIVLDLYFILVLGMGIEGAALATVIAQAVSLFVLFIYLLRKNTVIRAAFRRYTFDWALLKKGTFLGVPLATQHIFLSVGILALIWIVAPFGTDVVAAVTIVGRVETFLLLLFIEIASAMTTFVGQNKGASHWQRIVDTTNKVVLSSIGITVVITLLTLFNSEFIVGLFTRDAQVIVLSKAYLDVMMPFLIFISITIIFHGVLNGMGWVKVPMYCTLLAFCFTRVPLTYILGKQFGVDGIWWSVVIGWGIGCLYTFFEYRKLSLAEGRRSSGIKTLSMGM